ncbi:MAG TPA: tetratricopeptide repeat protein [Methanospirillum sp.]|nr:tetratricopeptide repeat protein [Methanospirillum sp.]
MGNNRTHIFSVIFLALLIFTTPVLAGCGPSKGLFSGAILNENIVLPTGSITQTPQSGESDQKPVESSQKTEDWTDIGDQLVLRGSYQEAISAYDSALSADQKSVNAWNGKMSALLYLEQYEEALSVFSEAEKQIPGDWKIWVNKGRAQYYLRKWNDGIASAEKALTLKDNNVDAMSLKADILAFSGNSGDLDKAFDLTTEILALDPENKDVWFVRGVALEADDQLDPAIEAFKKDLTYHPDRSCSYFDLTKIYIDEKNPDEALQVLSSLKDQYPEYDPFASGDGYSLVKYLINWTPDIDLTRTLPIWEWYFKNPDPDEKEEFLVGRWEQLLFALSPYILDNRGDFSTIDALIDPLIRTIKPQSDEEWEKAVYSYLMFAHNRMDEQGLLACDKAIALYPQLTDSYYKKGAILENLGRSDEAELVYDQALELAMGESGSVSTSDQASAQSSESPAHPSSTTKTADEFWDTASALYDEGKFAESLSVMDEAVKAYPENARMWSGQGAAFNNMKQYSDAISSADVAIGLDPTLAHAWYVKGYALEKLGKVSEALIYYEKTVDLDPSLQYAKDSLEKAKKSLKK